MNYDHLAAIHKRKSSSFVTRKTTKVTKDTLVSPGWEEYVFRDGIHSLPDKRQKVKESNVDYFDD